MESVPTMHDEKLENEQLDNELQDNELQHNEPQHIEHSVDHGQENERQENEQRESVQQESVQQENEQQVNKNYVNKQPQNESQVNHTQKTTTFVALEHDPSATKDEDEKSDVDVHSSKKNDINDELIEDDEEQEEDDEDNEDNDDEEDDEDDDEEVADEDEDEPTGYEWISITLTKSSTQGFGIYFTPRTTQEETMQVTKSPRKQRQRRRKASDTSKHQAPSCYTTKQRPLSSLSTSKSYLAVDGFVRETCTPHVLGPAEAKGQGIVQVGDELVALNGQQVTNAYAVDVVDMLRAAPLGENDFVFRRPKLTKKSTPRMRRKFSNSSSSSAFSFSSSSTRTKTTSKSKKEQSLLKKQAWLQAFQRVQNRWGMKTGPKKTEEMVDQPLDDINMKETALALDHHLHHHTHHQVNDDNINDDDEDEDVDNNNASLPGDVPLKEYSMEQSQQAKLLGDLEKLEEDDAYFSGMTRLENAKRIYQKHKSVGTLPALMKKYPALMNVIQERMELATIQGSIRTSKKDWPHARVEKGGGTCLRHINKRKIAQFAARKGMSTPVEIEMDSCYDAAIYPILTCLRRQFYWSFEEIEAFFHVLKQENMATFSALNPLFNQALLNESEEYYANFPLQTTAFPMVTKTILASLANSMIKPDAPPPNNTF